MTNFFDGDVILGFAIIGVAIVLSAGIILVPIIAAQAIEKSSAEATNISPAADSLAAPLPVAVAEMNSPAVDAEGKKISKLASPKPSVKTVCEPRYRSPSP